MVVAHPGRYRDKPDQAVFLLHSPGAHHWLWVPLRQTQHCRDGPQLDGRPLLRTQLLSHRLQIQRQEGGLNDSGPVFLLAKQLLAGDVLCAAEKLHSRFLPRHFPAELLLADLVPDGHWRCFHPTHSKLPQEFHQQVRLHIFSQLPVHPSWLGLTLHVSQPPLSWAKLRSVRHGRFHLNYLHLI